MNNQFDELSKSLVHSVTRRQAFKKFSVGLAGIALACFGLANGIAAAAPCFSAKTSSAIPGSQIGPKAGDYKGDGLAVVPIAEEARLRCVYQRLEGEVTPEGLWLTSTLSDEVNDRFRIVAGGVGRTAGFGVRQQSAAAMPLLQSKSLSRTGTVSIDGQTVRLNRAGLVEEYTVSMDGVRQDFVVLEKPTGPGELVLLLAMSGAAVEATPDGAWLVLENTGRKIAYSRLHVTDAVGQELTARMEVFNSNSESGKLIAEIAVIVNDVDAVYPVRIDPTFSDANWISMGTILGANGTVFAAAVDGSGNLYIGGEFTIIGDVFATNIAKWNGSSWSALGSGMGSLDPIRSAIVYALAVSGSDVYAGGDFTTAGGSPATNIAKWNGSSWSALGSGIGPAAIGPNVSALAVSGNDVYAGGYFTTAGSSPANYIAKWNGSSWSALGAGMNAQVNALAISGSDVYAGGDFTTAGGSAANYIAKWNGSTWSTLGSGIDLWVSALAVSGNNLYAGGQFTTAGGIPASNIAKWNGSSWTALGSGMDWPVEALAISGSDVYAGGDFTTAGGSAANYIAKWNGTNWTALGSGVDNGVLALAVSGSNVFVGGDFTTAGGSEGNRITKWNGSSWSALGPGVNDEVYALAVSGGDLYAGGYFTTAGGSPGDCIAKWNGSIWSTLGSGMALPSPFGNLASVYALAVSGSDVYVGGYFTNAGGSTATNIAKWDGSNWTALGSGVGPPSVGLFPPPPVYALAVSGGDLYAGGQFTTAGGVPANHIAKWNGSGWSALGSGLVDGGASVYALAVSGSDLYAGGNFTTAGGGPANRIAKWNGSSWSPLGSGMGGGSGGTRVLALAVLGNDLYVGGDFTTAGGSPANYIAKWNGSSWSALGSGMGGGIGGTMVLALAVSGSDLYAGGNFTTAGGSPANYTAKWNGSSWSALGSGMSSFGFSSRVFALTLSGSDLYSGGAFTTAGGKVSAYLAKAIVNPPILAIESDGFGGYFINFSGVPGSAYQLQRAPSLNGPWTPGDPQAAPASGLLEFWDPLPPPGQGYYRSIGE